MSNFWVLTLACLAAVLGLRPLEQETQIGVSNSASFALLQQQPAERVVPDDGRINGDLQHYDGREHVNKDADKGTGTAKEPVKEEPADTGGDDVLEAADKSWLALMPEASKEEKKTKIVEFRRAHKAATDERDKLAKEMTEKKAAFDVRKAQAEADVKKAEELTAKIEGENRKLEEDRVKIVEQALKTARVSEDERLTDGDNRLPNPGYRPKHLSETEEKINEKIEEAKAHDNAPTDSSGTSASRKAEMEKAVPERTGFFR